MGNSFLCTEQSFPAKALQTCAVKRRISHGIKSLSLILRRFFLNQCYPRSFRIKLCQLPDANNGIRVRYIVGSGIFSLKKNLQNCRGRIETIAVAPKLRPITLHDNIFSSDCCICPSRTHSVIAWRGCRTVDMSRTNNHSLYSILRRIGCA